MLPIYKDIGLGLTIYQRKSTHSAPHLHRAIEFVYVTQGSLAIGVGQNLYPMEKGDFAVVFPEMVHHYQVFSKEESRAIYILTSPNLAQGYMNEISNLSPKEPVITKKKVHKDIIYAVKAICSEFADGQENQDIAQLSKDENALALSYIHILLARSLPLLELVPKAEIGSTDLIYKSVSYISGHFAEDVSLGSMAHDLGISQFTLSRLFAKTFHRNFNQYLNEVRLDYAQTLLRHTDKSITDICYDSGFESQRTFNRCFSAKYHVSPREYRRNMDVIKEE